MQSGGKAPKPSWVHTNLNKTKKKENGSTQIYALNRRLYIKGIKVFHGFKLLSKSNKNSQSYQLQPCSPRTKSQEYDTLLFSNSSVTGTLNVVLFNV